MDPLKFVKVCWVDDEKYPTPFLSEVIAMADSTGDIVSKMEIAGFAIHIHSEVTEVYRKNSFCVCHSV